MSWVNGVWAVFIRRTCYFVIFMCCVRSHVLFSHDVCGVAVCECVCACTYVRACVFSCSVHDVVFCCVDRMTPVLYTSAVAMVSAPSWRYSSAQAQTSTSRTRQARLRSCSPVGRATRRSLKCSFARTST